MSEREEKPKAVESLAAHSGVRTLRELEEQEKEQLRRALYTDPLAEESRALEEKLATEDTANQAREARKEFTQATMRPMSEKMKGFRGFMCLLGSVQSKNVVDVFIFTTAAMFTIPIVVLLFGMHVVAPYFGADSGVCGGFMALGSTIAIMAMYVIYAFWEPFMGQSAAGMIAQEKKHQ
ncbi:hypothetical protein TcYC6_0070430 [Trypanosoma cruzi]|nr:hypothetical protein TcYC6_0070430 [Trypanosoma cruzi]